MTGIQPEGRCPKCSGTFKKNNNEFICPSCLTRPQRFSIVIYCQNERIVRSTTLNGKTIRTIGDAYALRNQAIEEKEAGTFIADKWKSKKRFEYTFEYLIWEWFTEKNDLMKQGRLALGYVPKLRTYIEHYYIPFFKDTDVRTIINCKKFTKWLGKQKSVKAGKYLSLKYQKNINDALSGFFNWLLDDRYINQVPKIDCIDVPEYEPETVDRVTQEKYLILVPVQHKPIFTFMIYQGARPGEVAALKGDAINGDTVTYKRTFSGRKLAERTKTKQIRHNYIFPEVQSILPKVFPQQFLFTYEYHGRAHHYTNDKLNEIHRDTLKRFNKEYNASLNIPLYEFTKHSFGTQFINEHPELESVLQEHFGHTRADMTKKYAKMRVVDVFRKLDNVKRLPVAKQQ